MSVSEEVRPLIWVGSSREDLKCLPSEVQDVMGYALYLAQLGGKHPDAKPLRGFRGSGVLEVVDDFQGDTYRAVYTVRLAGRVYVLHAFQKKARHGIKASQHDLDLIRERYRQAEEIHRQLAEKTGDSHE
jgi:phage-related protein